MKSGKLIHLLLAALFAAGACLLTACGGNEAEDAAEEAGDAIEEAGDAVENATE